MFASYKKHNNQLYNKLVKLSRNKYLLRMILRLAIMKIGFC